jgi:hypothetical protein
MYFKNNGAYNLGILPSGNVGIGTTNPTQKLDVRTQSGSEKGIYWNEADITDFNIYRDRSSPTWTSLRSNNGSGITIMGSADYPAISVSRTGANMNNVGIGTRSPDAKLSVVGSTSILNGALTINSDNNNWA